LHLIFLLSVYNNPLSLLKVKIEVKIAGGKVVNNIHIIGIVAYKSNGIIKKTNKSKENIKIA